ncbi:hypothetical protein Hdeb2414_s0022g00615211 [Helianthus debilis subsp. tardiflorus]
MKLSSFIVLVFLDLCDLIYHSSYKTQYKTKSTDICTNSFLWWCHDPLSSFKIDLLRHFKVHFSQLHPLGFMRVVHFELSCVAVSGEPSIPLFCMFYKLISNGDWFTFAKRKDSVSQPYYSFMPTSTYPKEWKSRFIFVSAAMIPESPPRRDAKAAIKDSVPILSADEIVQWKRMYENPTRAFTFSEGILAMGGLSPFYSVQPKAFF